jgi:hypothetical protein
MRASSANEKVLAQTKQMKIGLCEQVRVDQQTAANQIISQYLAALQITLHRLKTRPKCSMKNRRPCDSLGLGAGVGFSQL